MSSVPFEYLELPYCGAQTARIAKKLLPHYHCVLTPPVGGALRDEMFSGGFSYRPSAVSQDLHLEGVTSIRQCLDGLNSKRRNDIVQAVQKAQANGIEVSIDLFRRRPQDFADVYAWYFDVYRPYAATHFPNKYKCQLVEELHSDLLHRYRFKPFVMAVARWRGKVIGGSFLRHIPYAEYRRHTSSESCWPGAPGGGDVLQMFMLNSGHEPVGNFNTYIYYSLIEWCIRQGYRVFSFGSENIINPPEDYLNVIGSKRAWGTTTILQFEGQNHFMICNHAPMLHLRGDYFIFHRGPEQHELTYYANQQSTPKILSQWLSGDAYIRKTAYTRSPRIFSYLEARASRWENARIVLCDADGNTRSSLDCPSNARSERTKVEANGPRTSRISHNP